MGRKKSVDNIEGRFHGVYLTNKAERVLRMIYKERSLSGFDNKGFLNKFMSETLLEKYWGKWKEQVLLDELLTLQREQNILTSRMTAIAADLSLMKPKEIDDGR